MRLKKIILKGFKSFPDKTLLEFDDGVTAIVGPNGSGKSNIIEAVRWVMGEQSAKTLRGTRMDDVIFSGTHERKAINIAEVELILDNSDDYLNVDYEEVSILRRLSRTSGSTYMINNQECRLKDIVSLFMDSGLGKESFSVISQGEVEAIFNSKPEERRGIFEEAAGVFKYKVRKEDAEKKLEQTEDNLDRVQDILYELESQVEPLKEQSNIAKSYLEFKEKLIDLDIALSVRQIKDLNEEMKDDERTEKKYEKEHQQIDESLTTLEKNKKIKEKELRTSREKFEELNKKNLNVVREKERLEASLNLFDEKSRHREEFIREKEKTCNELSHRKEKEEVELEQIEKSYRIKKETLEEINREIKKLGESRLYLEGDKSVQMEELRSQYIDTLQQQTSLKNESSYLKEELSRNQLEKERFKKNVSELKRINEHTKKDLKEKNLNYEKLKEELNSLLDQYKEQKQFFEKAKEQFNMLNQKLSKKSKELEKSKAKALSLKEMQENYTGYYAGVRAVMKEKNKLSGIVGTVAESIKIPKKYLLAINTVLGSRAQFVIVGSEKNARDAIQYLKNHKSGRATFLPLTTIRARKISKNRIDKIQKMPGYLGIASELVTNSKKVGEVIDNLLGQTILAATLAEANEIARSIHFSNRVVSLDGDMINAGGSLTGGGNRSNLNPVFSQKAELNQLEERIQKEKREVSILAQDFQEAENQRDILQEEIEQIRLKGEDKRLAEQQMKSELSNLENEFKRAKDELKASNFEHKEKKELVEEYELRLENSEKSLNKIKRDVQGINKDMELLTSEKEDTESKRQQLTEKIDKKNELRNESREEIARVKTMIEHKENQIKDQNKQIKQLEQEIKNFTQDNGNYSKEEIEILFDEYLQKEQDIQKNQSLMKKEIEEKTEIDDHLNKKIIDLNNRLKILTNKKGDLAVKISRNDVRMEHLLEYLAEEYQTSYEEARLRQDLKMDLEDAKKKVRLLKKDIKELGPVNLNSIEEFETVNERYQFLTEQQNDLIEAKETLYNTMGEMDLIVEKSFKETFDRVKKEFSKVFPKMFGGGHAELILTDPDHLLETGIEITAQPPGKKLTRLSLLSGGERALTAISLLFSIIQVNPIPFVILDEAEAALDDANVIRFGKYLQNFEEDTQFVVITHRKGTMEQSDQLYGITMQEKGVSKIVGVSLKEAEDIEGVN